MMITWLLLQTRHLTWCRHKDHSTRGWPVGGSSSYTWQSGTRLGRSQFISNVYNMCAWSLTFSGGSI